MRFLLVLPVLMLTFLASCAKHTSSDKITLSKITECYFPDSTKEKAPLWVCGAEVEGIEISAVGSAVSSKAGIDYMTQQATLRARANISKQIATQIKSDMVQTLNVSTTQEQEKVDTLTVSIVKEMSNETLVGTKPIRTVVNSLGTIYVLVGSTKETYEKSLDSAIVASYKESPDLWKNAMGDKTDYSSLKKSLLSKN